MNPLVEAMGKQKNGNDYGGDLHTRKDSHLSAPMQGMEWHFSAGDINIKAEVNKTYIINIPVICSSADDHDVRFKQIAKPYLDDTQVFKGDENTPESNTSAADAPMVRLQSEAVP